MKLKRDLKKSFGYISVVLALRLGIKGEYVF